MSNAASGLYEFEGFCLDPSRRLLLRREIPVSITPRAFDLLVVLVQNHGQLLDRDVLLELVWRDAMVEEGNVSVCICQLRKVLGKHLGRQEFIETVSKRGYRFVAHVSVIGSANDLDRIQATDIATGGSYKPVEPAEPFHLPAALSAAGILSVNKSIIAFPGLLFSVLLMVISLFAANRYASTWRAPQAATNAKRFTSIAVLPFETSGLGDEDKFIGLGTADALITRLGQAADIQVRATNLIERYRVGSTNPRIAGKEQSVDAVLTGKILQTGDKMRLMVAMISVRDGSTLWSDHFDEKFSNAFSFEDQVSDRIAKSIGVDLLGEDRSRIPERSIEITQANEAYLKGRYFWNKRTATSVLRGLQYFRDAISLDPNFAEAYQGVADSYAILGLYSALPPEKAYPAAREAAEKALELNGKMASPHATLGLIDLYYDWNGQKAEDEFTQAIKADPNCAIAHSWSGEDLAAMGRFSEAAAEAKLAVDEDPASPIISTNAGWTYFLAGRKDEAIELLLKAIELDPSFPRAHFRLGLIYENRGKYDLAIAELNQAVQLSGGDFYYESGLGHAYAAAGHTIQARQILSSLSKQSRHRYVPGFTFALVYAGLNENSAAFAWLDKASADHSASMAYLKVDPALSGLRADSRFANVVSRIRF